MFNKMTDKAYIAATSFYAGKQGLKQLEKWKNYLYNAVMRYVESGDALHLTRAVRGGHNIGRYRQAFRTMSACSAHSFNSKDKEFTGKADKKKLENLRNNWEKIFSDAMGEEQKRNETPYDAFKAEEALLKYLNSRLKLAHENNDGKMEEQIKAMLAIATPALVSKQAA